MIEDDPALEEELRSAARGFPGPGAVCPDDETLASFYAGALDEEEEERAREHLAGCSSCVARAREARAFVTAMERRPRVARATVLGLALAAAIAAVALFVVWRAFDRGLRPDAGPVAVVSPPDVTARWRDFPVDPLPYLPGDADRIVWRGGEGMPEKPSPGTLEWAMEPYVAGDFASAAARLERRAREHPDDERALLYLGVSRLLSGGVAESTEPLRRLAETGTSLSEEASWYLALARLKSGADDLARPALRRLASGSGDRAVRARALLAEIDGAPAR